MLLNEQEAADFLHLESETLKKWRQQRRGPRYVRLEGRAIRYRQSDLDQYVASQVREAAEG